MGCCLSTKNPSSTGQNHRHSRSESSNGRCCVPPMEEETVKEVLSETPKQKPVITKVDEGFKTFPKPSFAMVEKAITTPTTTTMTFKKIEEEEVKVERKAQEEISEASEICSVSESVSTTTITEKKEDDDGEVKQKIDRSPARFRSYSGDFSGKRERVVGRSPVRRSDPSPGRRNDGTVRSVPGRELGQAAAARRGVGTNLNNRRDTGDSTSRRSRSPAMRTDMGANRSVLGRSPSTRKTGQSPGRFRTTQMESNQKMEESSTSTDSKWPPPVENESLENPLVSLECFIFL